MADKRTSLSSVPQTKGRKRYGAKLEGSFLKYFRTEEPNQDSILNESSTSAVDFSGVTVNVSDNNYEADGMISENVSGANGERRFSKLKLIKTYIYALQCWNRD